MRSSHATIICTLFMVSSVGGWSPSTQAQWQDVIRNLRHPEVKVRLAAVQQLGSAGYTAAAEYVAPLVMDPDDNVQFAAIDAELTFFLIEPVGARRVLSLTGASRSRAQEAFDAAPSFAAPRPRRSSSSTSSSPRCATRTTVFASTPSTQWACWPNRRSRPRRRRPWSMASITTTR